MGLKRAPHASELSVPQGLPIIASPASYMHACTQTRMHAHTCACTRTHARVHTHTHTHSLHEHCPRTYSTHAAELTLLTIQVPPF